MAKNILMKEFKDGKWVEIHPVTKSTNVYVAEGEEVVTVDDALAKVGADLGTVASDLDNVEDVLQNHLDDKDNPHKVTKDQVGLGNVSNVEQASKVDFEAHTGDSNIHVTTSEKDSWSGKQDALGFTPEDSSKKGEAGGYASLDSNSKVPMDQLPDLSSTKTYIVEDEEDRLALDTEELVSGDKTYETSTGDSHIWNGEDWHVVAKSDWQNINLEWKNIKDAPGNIEAIQDSVSKTHTHGNNNVLERLVSESEGEIDLDEFATVSQVNELSEYVDDIEVPVTSVNGETGDVQLGKEHVGLSNVDNVKQATKEEFNNHSGNNDIHVTASEKQSWNNKQDTLDQSQLRAITVGTAADSEPANPSDGDIWYEVIE